MILHLCRRTPERHHPIADEFVDGAAVGKDRLGHRREAAARQLLVLARRAALPGKVGLGQLAHHLRRHARLVPLEIDDAIGLLGPAAAEDQEVGKGQQAEADAAPPASDDRGGTA